MFNQWCKGIDTAGELWGLQLLQILGLMNYGIDGYIHLHKSNALMHFIDTYITELSATHGLVCSRQ